MIYSPIRMPNERCSNNFFLKTEDKRWLQLTFFLNRVVLGDKILLILILSIRSICFENISSTICEEERREIRIIPLVDYMDMAKPTSFRLGKNNSFSQTIFRTYSSIKDSCHRYSQHSYTRWIFLLFCYILSYTRLLPIDFCSLFHRIFSSLLIVLHRWVLTMHQ